MAPDTAEVIVIGLGAMGSATLHALARAGVRAVGIDRYHPPHDRGSTHGESRITRLAVGEGGDYVPLVRRTHAIWRELEAETGEELFLQVGGLIMSPRDGAAQHHGKGDFVRRTVAVAQEYAIPHEVWDADAIARHYPQFGLRGDELGFFEPSAGLVFPERCVAAQLRQAERHGAVLRLGERVLSVRADGGGVAVETDAGTLRADRAVLTAGPWLPELGGTRMAGLNRVHRQTLHWFAAEDPAAYAPGRFPVFIWMHGDDTEDYLYGFPSLPGTGTVKMASERYASTTTPDTVERTVSEAESRAIYERHVAGRLRGVTDRCVRAATCLYTVTPDAGFIMDALPDVPGALVASACSGHGFKHSAAIGEVLARQVAGGSLANDAVFGLGRFPVDALAAAGVHG